MKCKALIVILLLFTVNIVITGCMPRPMTEYPDFLLTSSEGDQVSLLSFRGRSIVVLGIGDPYT